MVYHIIDDLPSKIAVWEVGSVPSKTSSEHQTGNSQTNQPAKIEDHDQCKATTKATNKMTQKPIKVTSHFTTPATNKVTSTMTKNNTT